MLDVRFQYALHTTSFEELPLSDKSLQHFRKKLENSNRTHRYGNLNLNKFEPFPKNPAISRMFRENGVECRSLRRVIF